ncbi:PPP4R2r [Symbiodinium microadriaticum]|nr:PPP4R2r [Symbiodinium microadriaticum]
MTAVQHDMAWRHQMVNEVLPLDRPRTSASQLKLACRNPLSWNYDVPVPQKSGKSSLTSSRSASELSTSSYSSRSRTASSSSFRTAGHSSLGSYSRHARSSVLSIELENERQKREAVEREVKELRAQLAHVDPSRMAPAPQLMYFFLGFRLVWQRPRSSAPTSVSSVRENMAKSKSLQDQITGRSLKESSTGIQKHVAREGGEESKPNAHAALLQFASAAEEEMTLSDELEGIIRNLAETGAAACYPWDALRILLAKKMETVLTDFWRDAPDLTLSEGETFQHSAVEPLKQSLLEPRREGAPWTTQRLCELLAQPRTSYKSTRKFMYALQRAILITATEEAIAPRSAPVLQLSDSGGLLAETLEANRPGASIGQRVKPRFLT